MKAIFGSQSLLVQMVFTFIAIVFIASVAVGVPAISSLQNQLNLQAWSQVEKGQRVTRSLYDFQYNEILNLATITAQRPTLQNLLIQQDTASLSEYLLTLEKGAELDRIVICDAQEKIAASTVNVPDGSICALWKTGRYQYEEGSNKVFLTAWQPIEHAGELLGEVFVSRSLDTTVSNQLRDQTGLENLLWKDDILIATSLTGAEHDPEAILFDHQAEKNGYYTRTYEFGGITFFSGYFPLNPDGLFAEVSLDVTTIVATRTRAIRIVAISIFVVSLVSSILGITLVERINRPLVQLSEAAAGFSVGDMESPVQIKTSLREITQVATTLEKARLELLTTLTTLEKERDWSEHLLASITEGIVTIDDQLRIKFFSRGAERILELNAEEAIGRRIEDILRLSDNQASLISILPEALEHKQKVDVLLSNQQVASLAITGARLTRPGEKDTEIVLVFRDISQEEAIHRLLGQFLANVAHEFRTPLAALEASIELLLDQAPDLNKDELLELYTSLHLGILGLHTLVDNLLESANIEARRFRISPRSTDLRDIIADALQTMQPLLTKYDQHLTVELPLGDLIAWADHRRTVQVLINLISNAIRYGPPNQEILVRISSDQHFARLEVMDRGPGIPPEARINLFRRFVFPQSNDRLSPTGAGLGLSVVEAIITAHGGQVGVDDRPGKGSNFWFTLPLDKDLR